MKELSHTYTCIHSLESFWLPFFRHIPHPIHQPIQLFTALKAYPESSYLCQFLQLPPLIQAFTIILLLDYHNSFLGGLPVSILSHHSSHEVRVSPMFRTIQCFFQRQKFLQLSMQNLPFSGPATALASSSNPFTFTHPFPALWPIVANRKAQELDF